MGKSPEPLLELLPFFDLEGHPGHKESHVHGTFPRTGNSYTREQRAVSANEFCFSFSFCFVVRLLWFGFLYFKIIMQRIDFLEGCAIL